MITSRKVACMRNFVGYCNYPNLVRIGILGFSSSNF